MTDDSHKAFEEFFFDTMQKYKEFKVKLTLRSIEM